MNRTSPKRVRTLEPRETAASGVFRYRVRLQALFAGTAAVAFTTDDVIHAESTQQAEQRAIALWKEREPERTFLPLLTVQGFNPVRERGITLADLLGFAQAEGSNPAEVELVLVVGGAVEPAAVRPGEPGTARRFVLTTLDDPAL